ncbi:SIR2 family protein, partial [Chloroflexota bacterium]
MVIPKNLIEAIKEGSCVAFVGSGLSQTVGLPSWSNLLRQMISWSRDEGINVKDRQELEDLIEHNDFLLVAEELREQLGKENYRQFMVKVLQKANPKPSDVHMQLTRIPFSAVLTSNYDTVLESAYTMASSGSAPHVFTHADYPELANALREGDFYILKIHGTIDRIETVILGRTDYRTVMINNRAYHQQLQAHFSNKTVLFIGCSLNDPDILTLLDELRTTFGDYSGRHFAFLYEPSKVKLRRFERDYGIQVIPYTPSSTTHPEASTFLNDLAVEVAHSRSVLPHKRMSIREPLDQLVTEMTIWMRAIKYEVSAPQVRDDRTIDLYATLDRGTFKQRLVVRCIGGEVSVADVQSLDKQLDRQVPQGWLVSDRRISPRAKKMASGNDAIQIFDLRTFLEQVVWAPYFNYLRSKVQVEKILDRYVDLSCFKQEFNERGEEIGRDDHPSLNKYIDTWLDERGKMHISLLGDFGAGKSWFCIQFASRQLERYLNNPIVERIPVLINLRDFN